MCNVVSVWVHKGHRKQRFITQNLIYHSGIIGCTRGQYKRSLGLRLINIVLLGRACQQYAFFRNCLGSLQYTANFTVAQIDTSVAAVLLKYANP